MKYKSPGDFPNQIIVRETEYWYLTLWNNQYYLGRATVVNKNDSRRHLSELSKEEILELFLLIRDYELALKKTFNTTNFNWTCLMNNQYKLENRGKRDKLHFHVWPRYRKKVLFEGEIFEDEVFAHHYDKNKFKNVDREFLANLADKILENWEN
jgi:diadenosine tetraphosphate (Ap4A) HIT family hydrolase